MSHIDQLTKLRACSEAKEWASKFITAQEAWAACERGDWMLWLAGKLSGEPGSDGRRTLVLAACECARTALRYVPSGDDRPRLAIEAAEDWARGGATTMDQVRKAAHAASAAAHADSAIAAIFAAFAACRCSAAAAYVAAASAAAAAHVAFVAASRLATFKLCADIVRKHYPVCPLEDKS